MQSPRILAVGRDATLVLLLLMTVTGVVLYAVFGFRVSVLNGHSMEPTLTDGSLVFTKTGDSAAVGDVVKFNYNGIPTIHRVVGFTSDGLIETKGDNAKLFPEARPVPSSALEGRYVASLPPLHGIWRFIFKNPVALLLMVGALFTALPLMKGRHRERGAAVLEDGAGG